jgi:tetratricopeptide (TPR) repeat protein
MKLRRVLAGLILITALAGGLFFGWRWYTTPKLPHISLDGADKLTIEAVENARQEVDSQPRSGKSWGRLAMVLSVNGYLEPALICFSNAERFDGENPCWPYLHGVQLLTDSPHPKDGIPYMRNALTLARKPDQQAAIAFKLALACIDEGQFDEALQPLELLAQIQPDDPRVHYGLGLLAAGRDDRVAAREHLSKIADNPLARKRACLLLAALSEDDRESANKYRKILERFPPDLPWPDPFEGLMAGYKVNRFASMQQYLELDRQGRIEEAVALLRRFVSERPDEEVCHNLGVALFKKNEFKEATEAFRSALGFNPQNGSNHYYLGESLLHEGEKLLRENRSREAMELFRQAVAAEDKAISLETNLGDAFNVRGLALESFREAKALLPNSTSIIINLGETLAEQGQFREAQTHLEDAIRIAGSDDPRPRAVLEKWQARFNQQTDMKK